VPSNAVERDLRGQDQRPGTSLPKISPFGAEWLRTEIEVLKIAVKLIADASAGAPRVHGDRCQYRFFLELNNP
jgi:hypothetical protein